jgi:hypothetical protein
MKKELEHKDTNQKNVTRTQKEKKSRKRKNLHTRT